MTTSPQIGDRVLVVIPNRKQWIGIIKGEGRKGTWWNVRREGRDKGTLSVHKFYCKPTPIQAPPDVA